MIETTGLRELLAALRLTEAGLYGAVRDAMQELGDLVRDDAQKRFPRVAKGADAKLSAEAFETRVRPTAGVLVVVGQSLRQTTGLRPDYGALQVSQALVPARTENLDKAGAIAEGWIGELLRVHGF